LASGSDEERHAILARHLLANLHGAVFVETILTCRRPARQSRSTPCDGPGTRGIHTSSANKSMSVLRLWLEAAAYSVLGGYQVDRARYEELVGITARN
jgi:hypothetical protein